MADQQQVNRNEAKAIGRRYNMPLLFISNTDDEQAAMQLAHWGEGLR
ncbi:MAG: hypothetical protein IRY85_22120 [Micromonosporaceae bacterium]|nr:hypothetical protein [Micromonosporaceae bacterium]